MRGPRIRALLRPWVVPLLPGVALYLLAYVPSLFILVVFSFQTYVPGQRAAPIFTLDNYARFLGDPYYLQLLLKTLYLSAFATGIAVVLGYPVAYAIVRSPRLRRILLPIVALSFFVSSIVRLYGWLGLLGRSGVINRSLIGVGLIADPLPLAYTEVSVVVGLADFAIPYTVLVMGASINSLDETLELAAQNLGAAKWQAFHAITLPLTFPGVLSAAILAFALSLSAVIVPVILGGGRVPVLATQVYDSMLLAVNYPFAAATVVLILLVVLAMTLIGSGALRMRRR